MYIGNVWNGLPEEDMAEVFSRVVPTPYRSSNKQVVEKNEEAIEDPSRSIGTVLKYNDPKGYGFVEVDGTKEKLFFHIKETVEPGLMWLSRDERISFIIGEDTKGRKQAEKIALIEGRNR